MTRGLQQRDKQEFRHGEFFTRYLPTDSLRIVGPTLFMSLFPNYKSLIIFLNFLIKQLSIEIITILK